MMIQKNNVDKIIIKEKSEDIFIVPESFMRKKE